MMKLLCVICIVLAASPVVAQAASAYQVATITDVKLHQAAGENGAEVSTYDVSLKVGDVIYTARYTDSMGTGTVKYAAGRSLLVLVGEKKITYNDILGRSVDTPILSQKPATEAKASK
jgi:hypothetical protein